MLKLRIRGTRILCGVVACHCAAASLSAGVRLVVGPIAFNFGAYTQAPPSVVAYTNNRGVAAGSLYYQTYPTDGSAVRWSVDGSESLAPLASAPGRWGMVGGISDDGAVVGEWNSSSTPPTVLWGSATGAAPVVIHQPSGTKDLWGQTYFVGNGGHGMSESGFIAGSIRQADDTGQSTGRVAVRWTADGAGPSQLQDVESSATSLKMFARGLNNRGTIVGSRSDSLHPANAAVRWLGTGTAATRLDELSPTAPASQRLSAASGVNDFDVAVGSSTLYVDGTAYGTRPVRWDAGGTAVTPLAPIQTTATLMLAGATFINNAGVIIGLATPFEPGRLHTETFAVRWTANGTVATTLGSLGVDADGSRQAEVRAFNNSGTLLGTSTMMKSGKAVPVPTLWFANSTQAVAIDTLLGAAAANWTVEDVDDLSDTGWIAGWGYYHDTGDAHTAPKFFSMLIPEAGTYGLGDANFDTHVDFADLLLLAKHYGQAGNGSTNVADFDFNGTTDFADLLTLAKHYAGSSTATASLDEAFASEWALAQSLVPEPTFAGVAAGLLLAGGRRRGTGRSVITSGS